MNELLWFLRVRSTFEVGSPYVFPVLVAFALYQVHYVVLIVQCFWRLLRHGTSAPPIRKGPRPGAVLVMPTLLRSVDELAGLQKAIASAATNKYPGELTIIAAIDDGRAKPKLYAELEAWAKTFEARLRATNSGVRVLVTCTPKRAGKAVAIDNGVEYLKRQIEKGLHPSFPPLFFNMDADSVLGEHALVRLVDRLLKRHPFSDQYPSIVTSNVSIARSEYWRGWRSFFTVRGQLSICVAAEFIVSMLGKHNMKLHLVPGASGALYCTWSKLHLMAPKWAAFMQTLRLRDAAKWWLGAEPPSFTNSTAGHLPEAMTGPGDDTWVTWLGYCARWEKGELTLDLPRTPAHAFYYFVRGWFLRALQYEPYAVVETKTPIAIGALFKQRVRWNTSRVELSQRWSPALPFCWTLFSPTIVSTLLIVYFNTMEALTVILLPFAVTRGFLPQLVVAFALYSTMRILATAFGIALDPGGFKKHGHKMLGLVMSAPYHFVFNKMTTFWGYVQDVFLFGVNTGFSPEETHIRSRLPRVAIGYRLRRAGALAIRAIVHNDVPLGWFWFGWHETAWTPSGFEGWTTGKKRVLKPRHTVTAPVIPLAPLVPMFDPGLIPEPLDLAGPFSSAEPEPELAVVVRISDAPKRRPSQAAELALQRAA